MGDYMKYEDIMEVWIEAEQQSDNSIENETSDVLVHTKYNKTWVGTFVTLSKAKELMANSNECEIEKKFWVSDMIPIECLDREHIEAIIKKMIDEDSFYSTFSEYNDYD